MIDVRVKVARARLYTYPDMAVVCGEPLYEDPVTDTLLNPQVIIEVLSRSTEAYDRGEKFAHYRRLESLREYVLVAQERMRVERYARAEPGADSWTFSALSEPGERLELSALGCAVPLREIYERVTLAPPGELPLRS